MKAMICIPVRVAATLLLSLFFVAQAIAKENVCIEDEHRQFDFWLGDWQIEQKFPQPDGEVVTLEATTSVSLAAGGCALVEHWSGDVLFYWEGMQTPAPMRGLSVRYFNPDDSRWHILWFDSRARSFGVPFIGRFDDAGSGEFVASRQTPQGEVNTRIAFWQPEPGRVRWELAAANATGEWRLLWAMNMRRR